MKTRREGHIRERKPGSFEIRYALEPDPSTGKRRTATATVKGTINDAKRELRARLKAIDDGSHVDPTRETVAQFLNRWQQDWVKGHVGLKTEERWAELIRIHVVPTLGAMSM